MADDSSSAAERWLERRRSFVTAELLRFRVATYSLMALSTLAALTFAAVVYSTFPVPTWQAVALLLVAVFCAAAPILASVNLSKDGAGVGFVNPLEFIDRLEERAQAARAESFEQIQQQIGALSLQLGELLESVPAAAAAAEADAADVDSEPSLAEIRRTLPAVADPSDPQRGRFGGVAARGARRLSATTAPSSIGSKWRRVTLKLESTDGAPLAGRAVYFFLHDTFDPDVYRVAVRRGASEAALEVTAMGAFTAGVVADRGATRLEIDLTSPGVDAPTDWKAR